MFFGLNSQIFISVLYTFYQKYILTLIYVLAKLVNILYKRIFYAGSQLLARQKQPQSHH